MLRKKDGDITVLVPTTFHLLDVIQEYVFPQISKRDNHICENTHIYTFLQQDNQWRVMVQIH